MKNKYNFSQVAKAYCDELGMDIPCMEDYLKGIFSDLPIKEYEKMIIGMCEKKTDRSEYFPDFYI
jgi:hypothetical protein